MVLSTARHLLDFAVRLCVGIFWPFRLNSLPLLLLCNLLVSIDQQLQLLCGKISRGDGLLGAFRLCARGVFYGGTAARPIRPRPLHVTLSALHFVALAGVVRD